ncbi:hypothetical protein GUU_01902 [Malacoplasma iowae 695]|nr:hypothetical protein GUU_01902 [Malacoplasma iowae 695]
MKNNYRRSLSNLTNDEINKHYYERKISFQEELKSLKRKTSKHTEI